MKYVIMRAVVLIAAMFVAIALGAQSARPAFEVASVKSSDPAQRGMTIQTLLGGRFNSKGVPLRLLMTYAYHLRDFQIIGGPDWIGTDRWDIEARAEEGSIPAVTGRAYPNAIDPMAIRLQTLLEVRFRLKAHREMKEVLIYELTIAKSGLKMKLSEDQTPFRLPERGDAQPPAQRGGGVPRYNMRTGRGSVQASAVELPSLIQALSQQVGRVVVDKTGLSGLFDIKLEWTPDPITAGPRGGAIQGPEAAPPIDSSGPSIFTALEEQLGLKLESAKGPVEVLVIDSVQKPSEN